MVTHQIASGENLATQSHAHVEEGLGARLMSWVRRVFCGLHGHDNLVHFEKDRMFLQCASCGYESPGWSLTEPPPKVLARSDARGRALLRPHLIRARRIA